MAVFDFLKKKKKDDYLEMSSGIDQGSYGPAGLPPMQDLGMEPLPDMPGMPPQQDFPPMPAMHGQVPQQQQMRQPVSAPSAELDLIKQQVEALNYKMDALRSVLDTLNGRLANIESALRTTPVEKNEGWTY